MELRKSKLICFVAVIVLIILSNVIAAYIHNAGYFFAETALIDEFSLYTVVFLLITGAAIEYLCKLGTMIIFILSMLSMLIVTVVELALNSNAHNLLPFEVLTGYPYVAIFPTIGYALSAYVRNTLISKR
jgi:hypothetical protein